MNKTMERGYVEMHNAREEIPLTVFCCRKTFSEFAACPWFLHFLTFGRALLFPSVCRLMTFLCGPVQRCMWSSTKDHCLHVGFPLDSSADDLLQLFSRQCGRLSAYLKTFP